MFVGVSPDNLLVHVRARTAAAERAFGVTINQYKVGGRQFRANNRNPAVPADLHVQFVSGLSNYDVIKAAVTCTPAPGSVCGYDGGDFRSAYDISGNGSGQTVGFTLWGQALPQSDFTDLRRRHRHDPDHGRPARRRRPRLHPGRRLDDGE